MMKRKWQSENLDEHLGRALIKSLKKRFRHPVIIDGFLQGRVLRGGMLLALGWRLADVLKAEVKGRRIGLVLPPGMGVAVANIACVLADITPVNLNFTASRLAQETALKNGEVSLVITVGPMKARLKDFPWPERTMDVKELLQGFSKISILWRWFMVGLLPAEALRQWMGVPSEGGNREAVLLFTSGSAGEPKGVALSHRNLLANVRQTEAMLSGGPIHRLLACLPIFHSFGCTAAFWWPILGGPVAVTYVSPLETDKLLELIEKYEIDLVLNTPTFLRNFLRKARPEQLRSLKLVVTGAEKLPMDLARDFEAKFAVPVCEGYGVTEAAPVVAVNLIDFAAQPGTVEYEKPRRKGSVGQLVPGLEAVTRHPETREILPAGESGMIWLKGPNIFQGYLNDPVQTAKVLVDGWYETGDVGKIDADGFLFIEGRLSRFSKIAGEMVPHEWIETQLRKVFQSDFDEEFQVVVVGLPDKNKGESIFVLGNRRLNVAEVRVRLAQQQVPNLWIPRRIFYVETIPQMATGKLDLGACRKLAEEASRTEAGTEIA